MVSYSTRVKNQDSISHRNFPESEFSHFEAIHSILAVPNLPAHNIMTINYYVQLNSLRVKSNVAYLAVDGNFNIYINNIILQYLSHHEQIYIYFF